MSLSPSQITPEEVVYRTNSDESSVIMVLPSKMLYIKKGLYGGYLLYLRDVADVLGIDVNVASEDQLRQAIEALLSVARIWLASPNIVERYLTLSDIEKKYPDDYRIIKQHLDRLPEEVAKCFSPSTYSDVVVYDYVEVNARVTKVTKNYVVLSISPKPGGLKVNARAIRVYAYMGKGASGLLEEWKLKYPENEVVQRLYVFGERRRHIALKVVLEAPSELVPPMPAVAPATPATQQVQQVQEAPRSEEVRAPVLVNGFLVISKVPSEELLKTALPEIFKEVRIGKKVIQLAAGYFFNKIKTLKRKFYDILNDYAIKLGTVSESRTHYIYIIPKSKVGEFLKEIDELRKEYARYERQLKEFLLYKRVPPEVVSNKRAKVDPQYLDVVYEYLEKHGKLEEVRRKIENLRIADRFVVRLVPFAIDRRIIEEFVDEDVRKRIEEELMSFRNEIAKVIRERVKEFAKELEQKLQKIAATELRREMLENARKQVEEMLREAREFGIELPELEKLREMLTEEKVRELAVSVSEGRLRALLEF